MSGLSRNRTDVWYPLSYGSDGTVSASAHSLEYLPQGVFFAVCYGRMGHMALPLDKAVGKFYVAHSRSPIARDREVTVTVGGDVYPVSGLSALPGDWLFIEGGKVVVKQMTSMVKPPGSFGVVRSVRDRGWLVVLLFPEMIEVVS